MEDYSFFTKKIANVPILVIGDVILDIYYKGTVERLAQEAPTPVLLHQHTQYSLGGAANVCHNIAKMGAPCGLISVCGDDEAATIIEDALDDLSIKAHLIKDNTRLTTQKKRFHTKGQQLFRMDVEDVSAISGDNHQKIIDILQRNIAQYTLIILSDYGKGCLSKELNAAIIALAHEHGKKVVIDPIGQDYHIYNNADYITPNFKELQDAGHKKIHTEQDVLDVAHKIMADNNIKNILLTRSEDGVSFISKSVTAHFATAAQEVFDVTGAGDTVISIFSLFIAMQVSPVMAARYANNAGGVVVAKYGVANVTLQELLNLYADTIKNNTAFACKDIVSHETLFMPTESELTAHIMAQRTDKGQKIAFTNGCFDILHDGHLHLLEQVRAMDATLVVAINSDASVKALKGEGRPVLSQKERMDFLLGIDIVSAVIVFDDATPYRLIDAIKPDILIKGEDYQMQDIVGADIVTAYGGEVYRASLKAGFSTTKLIETM